MINLSYQEHNSQSALLVFINADSDEEAYGKYLSLWNWAATESEADWVGAGQIVVRSTREKMLKYFWNLAIMKLWGPKYKGKRGGCDTEARQIAKDEFASLQIRPESKLKFRKYAEEFHVSHQKRLQGLLATFA